MSGYLKDQGARATVQRQPIPGREADQVENSAGGYVFPVDDWVRLERFLILGAEGGSYYASQRNLVTENVGALRRCIAADPARTVRVIRDVSHSGRAPRNTEAIFALAICAADRDAAPHALDALDAVCRTGTHMFQFLGFVEQFRGWGRALRRGVGSWYASKDPDALAYQMVKYREREGWRHRDALRLAHPGRAVTGGNPRVETTEAHDAIFDWTVKAGFREPRTWLPDAEVPEAIHAYREAQRASTPAETVKLIEKYGRRLPREAIQPEHLNEASVWVALLEAGMPMTALMRNLATMTRNGVLRPMGSHVALVTRQLTDADELQRARVHPFSVLLALTTYRSGHGFRGQYTWNPVGPVIDALDEAFYASFANVEPTGKRRLVAIDVSGSMGHAIANTNVSCREAAGAMAMVTVRTEANYHVIGFTNSGWSDPGTGRIGGFYRGSAVQPLGLTARQRLDDVTATINRADFGGTDCALPMLYALAERIEVDAFEVYTDNETWHGSIHPSQALTRYREATGIDARLIVVGMAANPFSIADPRDGGMLDVVGFDAAAPSVMAEFIR